MISRRKIEAILLYFANNTDPKTLGKTKMMKLLYFLDFNHAKLYGAPVTYDAYYNLQHGPIPSKIKNLIDELEESPEEAALARILTCEHPKASKMCRLKPKRKFKEIDRKMFSETELELMKKLAKKYCESPAKDLEEKSHKEAPWKLTSHTEKIPYYLAAMLPGAKASREEIKLVVSL